MHLSGKFSLTVLTILLVLSTFTPAWSEVRSGERIDLNDPVNEDFYAGAGQIRIKGGIAGDANLAGGEIDLLSDIKGDLNLFGGNSRISGNTGDDIHMLCGQTSISGKVGGDVFIAGGDITIEESASIAGDLYIAGGKIRIFGTINGKVFIAGGHVYFSGTAGKGLQIRGDDTEISGTVRGPSSISSNRLNIAPQARFSGNVSYWSKDRPDFDKHMSVGKAEFDSSLGPRTEPKTMAGFFPFIIFLAGMLVIYVLQFSIGNFLEECSVRLRESFLTSFGAGILYYSAAPAAALLLLVMVITFPFGLLLGAVYGLTFLFARPVTAVVLAKLVQDRTGKTWDKTRFFLASSGIYFMLLVLGFIPVAGWLLSVITVSAATGSFLLVLWTKSVKS